MADAQVIMAGIGLALALYDIVEKKITKYIQIKKDHATQLVALRKEVRRNLVTVNELLKKDTSALAVYDPAIRKSIGSLRHKELLAASEQFEPIVGKLLKKAVKKAPDKKDPMRIFWNIKDTATKLADLEKRMEKVPDKPGRNAPRVILSRRLPALQYRLQEIDGALGIVPVK